VPELSNPIFPLFAQQIEQLLAPSGHTPLLCTQTPGGISEDEYMNSRRVEKIKYYIRITERRPANKKFFFGWIKRTVQ